MPLNKKANNMEQQPPKRLKLENDEDTATSAQVASTCCQRVVARPPPRVKTRHAARKSSRLELNLLQELMGPLDDDEFMKNSFRRHAVHVQWIDDDGDANLSRYSSYRRSRRFPDTPILQSLLDHATVTSLIRETSSESIFVWIPKPGTPVGSVDPSLVSKGCSTSPPGIHSIEIPDAETALKLHQLNGHALYFRASPKIEQKLVGELLRYTGFGMGQYDPPGSVPRMTTMGRGEVEVFIGGRPNPAATSDDPKNLITGWHYDFQENFTVQISGVKRWTLHPGIVKHPLRGCTPHYDTSSAAAMSTMESQVLASRLAHPTLLSPTSMLPSNPEANASTIGKEEVVEMRPGDVLYFPAGMWHTVETIEPGISINISLMASNYASVTCQALQHLLLQHDEWRQGIHHRDAWEHSISAVEVLQRLLESLPSLIEKEMTTNGLCAQGILPPVVRKQRNITENDSKDDEDLDDDTDDDDDTVEDDMEEIIDVNAFDVPESYTENDTTLDFEDYLHSRTHVLIQNPLAILLHKEREIRQCFKHFAPLRCDRDFSLPHNPHSLNSVTSNNIKSIKNEDQNTSNNIYILNVNFAGNESHESVVRVRLRMIPSALQIIQEHLLLSPSEKCAAKITDFGDDSIRQHIKCLVFFGYLIWKELT